MADLRLTIAQARQGITLATGTPHTVTIGGAGAGVVLPAAVFALQSAFPAPGVSSYVKLVHQQASAESSARLVVFGHADRSGSVAFNKTLSDRRAKALFALLTRDLATFDRVAEDDAWGVAQYQSMLRGVGCNPGAIDGAPGPMTRRAIAAFQKEYNLGLFHRAPGAPSRRASSIAEDGALGPETTAALRDAYLAGLPEGLPPSRFAGPGFAGCSELNPCSARAADNRRVMVALLREAKPSDPEFPCKEGDVSACPADGASSGMRCAFYRHYFGGGASPTAAPSFSDLQWLGERTGHVHMSALTSLPDSMDVRFEVCRWLDELPERMPSSADPEAAAPKTEVIATVKGEIRCGVAYARWKPPEAFNPLELTDWLVDHDLDVEVHEGSEDAAADDIMSAPAVHPPVFRVESRGAWGYSRPPGVPVDQIGISEGSEGSGLAICEDGSIVPWSIADGAAAAGDGHPPALPVFALALPQSRLRSGGEGDPA